MPPGHLSQGSNAPPGHLSLGSDASPPAKILKIESFMFMTGVDKITRNKMIYAIESID